MISVDQVPVHKRFHIAAIFNAFQEIRNQHQASGTSHLKHAAGEGGGYWRVEIIEKTRSINKIKLARFQLSGENLTYRAIHRTHAKASIVVSNNGETGGVLVDGQEVLNLPSL